MYYKYLLCPPAVSDPSFFPAYENAVLSNPYGEEIPAELGDCITYDQQFIIGDINQDSVLNVLDIVLMVNFALGINEPEGNEIYLSDYNQDGSVNVLDIVQLVNTILADS